MGTAIRDYNSRIGSPESKKFGTFSYLPEMETSEIRKQVAYMIEMGWICAVEHVEPSRASDDYWYMWKLPMFGERDVNAIMTELTACWNANPDDHVRIIGYDNKRQTQGQSMVIYRGKV
jgi:ribulose-bisphosphate carboxylase small chain